MLLVYPMTTTDGGHHVRLQPKRPCLPTASVGAFLRSPLRRIEKRASEAVPTAGVRVNEDGYFEMIYNPAFFAGLPDVQRTGVLVHEFYHLVFEHVAGATAAFQAVEHRGRPFNQLSHWGS